MSSIDVKRLARNAANKTINGFKFHCPIGCSCPINHQNLSGVCNCLRLLSLIVFRNWLLAGFVSLANKSRADSEPHSNVVSRVINRKGAVWPFSVFICFLSSFRLVSPPVWGRDCWRMCRKGSAKVISNQPHTHTHKHRHDLIVCKIMFHYKNHESKRHSYACSCP